MLQKRALFGGGPLHNTPPHNRRAFVTPWPFRPRGNKFVRFVPPLMFGEPLSHMNAVEAICVVCFPLACACIACKTHPAWPTMGLFKHSGLGWEDVDPSRGSAIGRPTPDGWDQQRGMEKNCASVQVRPPRREETDSWRDCRASTLPSLFPNIFALGGFYEAQ